MPVWLMCGVISPPRERLFFQYPVHFHSEYHPSRADYAGFFSEKYLFFLNADFQHISK